MAYDSYYSLALLVVLVVIVWVIIVRIDSHEEATARGRKDRRREQRHRASPDAIDTSTQASPDAIDAKPRREAHE